MADCLEGLAKHNLDLLNSGNFSDAEIICRKRTWKVHKVILQSRCAWFEKAFANNWQEAQTGRIHLEQERPEQIDDVLKFIYSGWYIPDREPDPHSISPSDLGNEVSLWRTADFFLLPDLKEMVSDYLFERFVATLQFFHAFSGALHKNNVRLKHHLDIFFIDLTNAVEKIYECPAARELQKLFAIFVCGLREHLPDNIRQDLNKRIPAFRRDVSFVLTILHFPQATNNKPKVSDELEDAYVSVPGPADSKWPIKVTVCFRCFRPRAFATKFESEGCDVTFDPFSFGTTKWCKDCAYEGIKRRLEDIFNAWSE